MRSAATEAPRIGTEAMSRNHSALVHGAVERARPVSPSSESGSTATGRRRSSGVAFPTPTGANVDAGVADANAAGVVTPGAASLVCAGVAFGAGDLAGVTDWMIRRVKWPSAS
jgi:hypothetical protein